MVNVGIIGCGKIAEKHLSGYFDLDGVSVTVTDIDKDKQSVAKEYGVKWTDNADDLFQDPMIDIIDVCTPTSSHLSIITSALEHQKHVITEKPLVINSKDANTIKLLAEQMGKKVFVAYPFRFCPTFQKIVKILENGIIGTPYFSLIRLGGRGSHQAWKHQKNADGGAINEMLVHALDLVLWFFKEIEEAENLVTETILKTRVINGTLHDVDAEDFTLLNLRSKNGVKILCQSDLITPSYMNYIEIHGTNGSIFTSILDLFPTVVFCKEARGDFLRGENIIKTEQVNLFKQELAYFIECIKENKEPKTNGIADSVAIAKLIESTF